MKRRQAVKNLSFIPLAGTALAGTLAADSCSRAPAATGHDLFNELGVKPIINASVTMTFLSGSLMLPEVMEAIQSTSHDFVNMYDLQDKVGAKLAGMLHCEAAMVTSGAACAMTLATAACITGSDQELIDLLPDIPGPRREVIIQKSHRYVFDHAIRITGVKLIEVEGPDGMEQAFNDNTVMGLFFNAAREHSVSHEEFVAICKRHNIPSFIDAAADVPPKENLFKYQKIGFDLVTFSGGKMLRGPQSAGLLFGRKDLIEAAKLNHSPHECPIGRPMKVNKEEMFGMYAAVKAYLERDHEKEWREWLDRTEHIASLLSEIPTLKSETNIEKGPANAFPSLHVTWDQASLGISPREVVQKLQEGNPSIVTTSHQDRLNIGVVLLKPEQVDIVAGRVKEVINSAV